MEEGYDMKYIGMPLEIRKNLAGLRSYPDAVQKAVQEHPTLGKVAPQEKSIIAILLGNLLLFTVVFSVLGLALFALVAVLSAGIVCLL